MFVSSTTLAKKYNELIQYLILLPGKCYLRLSCTRLLLCYREYNDRQIEWIELILEMTFLLFVLRILQNKDMFKEHVFQWNRSIINL